VHPSKGVAAVSTLKITVDGVERIVREDPEVPLGVQVFCRTGQILGNSPIGSGQAPAGYDELRLNPIDYEIIARTQSHRPGAPTAKRGVKRLN
jgi:hypothetical protein